MLIKYGDNLITPAVVVGNKDEDLGKLIIKNNGTKIAEFFANAKVDTEVDLQIPTATFYWGE